MVWGTLRYAICSRWELQGRLVYPWATKERYKKKTDTKQAETNEDQVTVRLLIMDLSISFH